MTLGFTTYMYGKKNDDAEWFFFSSSKNILIKTCNIATCVSSLSLKLLALVLQYLSLVLLISIQTLQVVNKMKLMGPNKFLSLYSWL